jgi:hypothetical protein
MRLARTYTIETEISEYVDRTRGGESASERVNQLLKLAIEQEEYNRLEAEAARFFSGQEEIANEETREFRKAGLRTLRRD